MTTYAEVLPNIQLASWESSGLAQAIPTFPPPLEGVDGAGVDWLLSLLFPPLLLLLLPPLLLLFPPS